MSNTCWLLQAAAALCYPNALVDVISTRLSVSFRSWWVWILAWKWACSGDFGSRACDLVETTSRIRFHGLRFWFLRLVELANSFWVCWTWNAWCSCVCAFGRLILMARMGRSSVLLSLTLWCPSLGVAVIIAYGHFVCAWLLRRFATNTRGLGIAFEEGKATPRVDVAETPQASPFLEAHGKQFFTRPGPSSVSPHSLLVRALTGQTLVVRWSSLDDVLHCIFRSARVFLFTPSTSRLMGSA